MSLVPVYLIMCHRCGWEDNIPIPSHLEDADMIKAWRYAVKVATDAGWFMEEDGSTVCPTCMNSDNNGG